jgi:hypothetical protein
MIAAISANGFLSAMFGGRGPFRIRSVGTPVAPSSNDSSKKIASTGPYNSVDTVEISALGRELSEAEQAAGRSRHDQLRRDVNDSLQLSQADDLRSDHAETQSANSEGKGEAAKQSGGTSVAPEQEQEVRELKQRDQEVRRHEQAHKAAAGTLASSGPSFEYQTGPDGQRYAVGGEVNIDTSAVPDDPQATIAKMQQVRRAALAPANPSGQDRSVAAKAAAMEQEARAELSAQRAERQPGADDDGGESRSAAASTEVDPDTISAPGSSLRRANPAPSVSVGQLHHRLDVFA